ncbi:hypothetical protein KVT40_000359 [Elsinoe batatas]|uniref:Uncharacterized protein n=1 Tax=Elsinoe batatas TaxID=2601811 RepID=A0A8K0L7M2_9PEZI|nr:hypothetical protein KVT40_000359 [Elsinoe batatas]
MSPPPWLPLLFSPYTHLPHPSFAETQPLPHTILTTHVLHRGFQSGALLALPFASAEYIYRRRQSPLSARALPSTTTLSSLILRRAGVGAVIGTGFMVPGLFMRMVGREEIEWRDRSWRLLENEGQMEVDGWSCLGMIGMGGLVGMGAGRGAVRGWQGVVGVVAVGNLVGVGGYLVSRYGLRGGEGSKDK